MLHPKRRIFFILLLLFSQLIFCQKLEEQKSVASESKKYINHLNFKKAREHFFSKQWDSTLLYTQKQLQKKFNETELINFCHFFRGRSFLEKGIFKEASKEYATVSEDFVFYVLANVFLGEIELRGGKYKKALDYFVELENVELEKLLGIEKSNLLQNIGLCYLGLSDYKKAESYLLKTLKIKEKSQDTTLLIGAYINTANLYYSQYKDDLAIPYFKKAYNLASYIKDFVSKKNTALNMAVVEENRKNLTASIKYRKEYEQWVDSLNNQSKIWQVAKIEKEFAVKQKQQEVNVLKAENETRIAQRNGFLYAVIGLLLVLLTITFFYRKIVKAKKIIVNQNEKLDALNATKDKLFSIVSHDLRSSVNTLKLSNKKLISNLEKDNIQLVHQLLQENSAIVGSAYNLLDNLLNWALLQTKQAYFEMKEVQLFFAVEHVAYNYLPLIKEHQLQFENTVSKLNKVFADQESLKIILRNLLDNAIKFTNQGAVIKIYTQNSKRGFLDIVVEDSGIGMDGKTLSKLNKETIALSEKENKEIIGSGLGLQLCKSMIQKNNGTLIIESTLGNGTKMIVSLLKSLPNDE